MKLKDGISLQDLYVMYAILNQQVHLTYSAEADIFLKHLHIVKLEIQKRIEDMWVKEWPLFKNHIKVVLEKIDGVGNEIRAHKTIPPGPIRF